MKKNIVLFFIAFAAVFLFSCKPETYYVAIYSDKEFELEREFLASLFEKDEIKALGFQIIPDEIPIEKHMESASVFINFIYFWDDGSEYSNLILLSKKYYAPQDNPVSGRVEASLSACFDGTETLFLIDEIKPPFTALRAEGLAADDKNYPLAMLTGIKIDAKEGAKKTKRSGNRIRQLAEILDNAAKPLIQTAPELLWIAAGGDLMLDSEGADRFLRDGAHAVFGGTADMLASSDLAIVNLEGVISSRGTKVPKSFNFRFNPEIAPALRATGIDAVLHANNHVFDYGLTAFLDSLSFLEQADIGIAGAGINIEAASEPFVFRKGNAACYVFGLASFSRERNGWDGVTAAALADRAGMLHASRGGAEKIKEKFSHNGLNIVLFHGGIEKRVAPDSGTRELYKDLIAGGADLVIGSHPHTVQGFEWINGKPVFWSLGNYVFTGEENMDGYEEGLFIRLGFYNGRMLYMEPFALELTHTGSDIASGENMPGLLEVFYRRSRQLMH